MSSIFDSLSQQEASRTDGTMRRAALLRRDLNDHERATVRLFERIRKQTEEAAEARLVVEFPLSPELAAAYAVWCDHGERDLTLHFPADLTANIGEAPIGPYDPDPRD